MKCWTCDAMLTPGFSVEAAQISGIALGLFFSGGHDAPEAHALARRWLCDGHYHLLRHAVVTLAAGLGAGLTSADPSS